MNKHIEKAKELRNATPMVHNCAQTIMEVYADDLGINKELANHLGCNFGGGMKCGSVCGAITSGLMILGAKGIDSPAKSEPILSKQFLIIIMDLLIVQIYLKKMQRMVDKRNLIVMG